MNNALKYVKMLEGTGITREQAEVQIQIISDILEGDLVTKQDIKSLESKFDSKFDSIEHKILQSEYRMTIKLGSIVTIVIAAATAIIKIF